MKQLFINFLGLMIWLIPPLLLGAFLAMSIGYATEKIVIQTIERVGACK